MAHALETARVATIRALFPNENILTTDTHGRVRHTSDQFVHDTVGATHVIGDGDAILFGGLDLPKGSRILSGFVHTDDMMVAGTSTIEVFIGSDADIQADTPPIQMKADGDAAMSVRIHTEYRLLPVIESTGVVNVPLLTETSRVYAIASITGTGWDIDGAVLLISIFYAVD